MLLFDQIENDGLTQRTYSDEGYMTVPATIARTGVQEYLSADIDKSKAPSTFEMPERLMVYRPESEVFSKESMASFANKPVTDNHPPELLTSENVRQYSVGTSDSSIDRSGDMMTTTLRIMDADAIKSIEGGRCQLSNGYHCDIDWTEGITPTGVKYDAIQRNIRGNHIALVDAGRAGPVCSLADSGDTLINRGGKMNEQEQKKYDDLKEKCDEMKAAKDSESKNMASDKYDDMKEKYDDLKAKYDTLEGKYDEMKASNDEHKKENDEEKLDEKVAEKMDVVDCAMKIDSAFEWRGKSTDKIKREIVAGQHKGSTFDSKSDDYIAARFDALVEAHSGSNLLDAAFAKSTFSTATNDKAYVPADQVARNKLIESNKTAWQGGVK